MPKINTKVLMSGADYFDDQFVINAHMNAADTVNLEQARAEHATIKLALEEASVEVLRVPPPKDCQDGVYTANWALVRGEKAVMSRLPNKRKEEEPYAEQILREMGKEIIKVPDGMKFSGQGDALPCGDLLFIGSEYRTDKKVHEFVAESLNYKVISLKTRPKRRLFGLGPRVINPTTGWPDSYYYDLDLALAVLRTPSDSEKGLIAWCPQAFTWFSRRKLRKLKSIDKIEVSRDEATKGFACNLVSTGEQVIMSDQAPILQKQLENLGFRVSTIEATELRKGGGFIRCITLTLD